MREWPNRLGILERFQPHDTVNWHRDLAPEPPHTGRILPHGNSPGAATLVERRRWLRSFVKRLEHTRGVSTYVRPDAPCAILLTPSVSGDLPADLAAEFGDAVQSLAGVLPEFPGGLQLRVTDHGWERASEYAEAIERLLREDE